MDSSEGTTMATKWYVNLNGQEQGPMSLADLIQHAQTKAITRDTLVKAGAHGNWIPASQIEGLLASLDQATHQGTPSPAVPNPSAETSPAIAARANRAEASPAPTWIIAAMAFLCGIFGVGYLLPGQRHEIAPSTA